MNLKIKKNRVDFKRGLILIVYQLLNHQANFIN